MTGASDRQVPGTPARLEIGGVQLTATANALAWLYRPAEVVLARTAAGAPQFTLLEAGSMAMLSLTTALEVSEQQLETIRPVLAARLGCRPEEIDLSAQEFRVDEAALLAGDGSGTFAPMAVTTSSGAAGYHAAFTVRLSEEQLAGAKRAAAGQCGWLAARCTLTDFAPSAGRSTSTTTSSSSSYSSTSVTTSSVKSTFQTSTSYTTADTAETGRAEEAVNSAQQPEDRTATVRTDACHWGLDG